MQAVRAVPDVPAGRGAATDAGGARHGRESPHTQVCIQPARVTIGFHVFIRAVLLEGFRSRPFIASSLTCTLQEYLCYSLFCVSLCCCQLCHRDVWRELIAREGSRGAAKGFSLNLIKGPIAFSVSLTTYDLLRAAWHDRDGSEQGSDGSGGGGDNRHLRRGHHAQQQ